MLEKLTGVRSSKNSYYVELKKQINETKKRNTQLEILYNLAKSMDVDLDLIEIIDSIVPELKKIIYFDHLGLVDFTKKNSKQSSFLGKADYQQRNHTSSHDFAQVLRYTLNAKGAIIGNLLICNREKIDYSESDRLFLEQLSAQLAVYLENRHLYDQAIQRKIEWEETFRAVRDPIIFIDLEHNIKRVNEGTLNCYGHEMKDILGGKCYHLLHNRYEVCNPCQANKAIRERKPAQQQVEICSGKILDLFYYPVYNSQNEIYGVIQYARDVTRSLEIEAHRRNMSKQIALGEMAARVAHELNNPLTVILGNVQIALNNLPEDHEDYKALVDAYNYGLLSKNIIKDLNQMVKHDNTVIVPVDLHLLIDESIHATEFQIDYTRVELIKDYFQHLPLIKANPEQLKQVIINLLTNAWDALNEIPQKRITIKTGLLDEKVFITLEDNGEGIRPEHLSKIFEPFFTTKPRGNTGLGLSLSHSIINTHGGKISARSDLARGTTFKIILPLNIE